ncbi:unnamed protein product [Sphagnum balticum]
MYIFGGSDGNDSRNDIYEFDLVTANWKKIESKGNIPTPREGHSACLIESRYIVIYGGWNGEKTFDDLYVFDVTTSAWKLIEKRSGAEPIPRESQSCCMIRDYMYVFGGQGINILVNGRTYENFFNDLYRFKVILEDGKFSAVWEKLEPKGRKPSKRSSHSSCAYKNRYMYIIGGEGYCYDVDEDGQIGEDHKQVARNNNGNNEENVPCYPKSDVWYYDVDANEWFQLKITNEKIFIPRFAHSCNIYEDVLVVFGGLRDYAHSTKDICVLSLNGVNPFDKNSSKRRIKPATTEHKIICSNCKVKYPNIRLKDGVPIEEEKKVEKALSDRGTLQISTSFLYSMANLMNWPFAAFGLLTDNSLITMAKVMKISYLTKRKIPRFQAIGEEMPLNGKQGAANDDEFAYIQVEDDGFGWSPEEFIDILYTYDEEEPAIHSHLNTLGEEKIEVKDETQKASEPNKDNKNRIYKFGSNMKLAGFRLGKTLLYLTRDDDSISIALLTANKKYNPNIHNNHVFYVSWSRNNPKEFRTAYGQKNKLIIFNMLGSLFDEDELVKKLTDKCRNLLLIFDLNTVVTTSTTNSHRNMEYELFLKKTKDSKNSDVIYRTVNKSVARFGLRAQYPNNLVELSLKTYLSYLFLEPQKANLTIFFNEDKINFVKTKEVVPFDCPKLTIDEPDIYEGVFYKCNTESKETSAPKEYAMCMISIL